jgi:hypothetical protein
MNVFLAIIAVGIGAFEITGMIRRNEKKEITVFSGIALLTILSGYLYFSDPLRTSIAHTILSIIGKEF